MKKLIAVFLCLALLSLSAFAETEMSVKLEDYLSRIDESAFDDMREEWDDLDEDLLEYSQDHSEALRICYEKAEQGDANAQRIVGEMYYAAYEVERDLDKAREWVMKAVGQGDAEAQALLGTMYLGGHGVERDLDKAYELVSLAADQGLPYAQCLMGTFSHYGIGTDPDDTVSFDWFMMSAKSAYRTPSSTNPES